MTKREYQELREFLAVRFDAMDQRFDALEEQLIRIELLAEENHHQMRIVAERIVSRQKAMAEGRKIVRPEKAAGFGAQGRLLRGLGNPVRPLKA
jgi:hypothetical protein